MGRWTTPHSGETKGWRRRTQYSDAHVARVIFDFPSSSLGQQNKIRNHHRSAGCRKSSATKGLCSDGFVGCCFMVRLSMRRWWGFIANVGATFGTVRRSRCRWRPKVRRVAQGSRGERSVPSWVRRVLRHGPVGDARGVGFYYGVRATLGSVRRSTPPGLR